MHWMLYPVIMIHERANVGFSISRYTYMYTKSIPPNSEPLVLARENHLVVEIFLKFEIPVLKTERMGKWFSIRKYSPNASVGCFIVNS